MGLPNWLNLSKSATDPQTIPEAIAEAIANHNADTEAHLGTEESLETHRANTVIDHPAESVVNDKLDISARKYVAIVDPASDEDFDTIEGALAYAQFLGGGTIYLAPGTHYLNGAISWPETCSIEGSSALTSIISAGHTSGEYISFDFDNTEPAGRIFFENIVFDNLAGGALYEESTSDKSRNPIELIGCVNLNAQLLTVSRTSEYIFNKCGLNTGTNPLIASSSRVKLENTTVRALNLSQDQELFTISPHSGSVLIIDIESSDIQYDVDQTHDIFDGRRVISGVITNNVFYAVQMRGADFWACFISNNNIGLDNDDYVNQAGQRSVFMGNRLSGGTGNLLRFTSASEENIAIGNIVQTAISDSGTGNVIANNIT